MNEIALAGYEIIPGWLSADNCRLDVTANSLQALSARIYVATRAP